MVIDLDDDDDDDIQVTGSSPATPFSSRDNHSRRAPQNTSLSKLIDLARQFAPSYNNNSIAIATMRRPRQSPLDANLQYVVLASLNSRGALNFRIIDRDLNRSRLPAWTTTSTITTSTLSAQRVFREAQPVGLIESIFFSAEIAYVISQLMRQRGRLHESDLTMLPDERDIHSERIANFEVATTRQTTSAPGSAYGSNQPTRSASPEEIDTPSRRRFHRS